MHKIKNKIVPPGKSGKFLLGKNLTSRNRSGETKIYLKPFFRYFPTLFFAILFPVLLCGGGGLSGNKPSATVPLDKIIIPADADICEKFAASELAKYAKRITGRRFEIVAEKPGQHGIYIGKTEKNKGKAALLENKDAEAFFIFVEDNNILLAGNSPRGTLYAVYRFLERQGCVWCGPGYDFVPRMQQLLLKNIESVEEPAFKYRYLRFIKFPLKSDWQKKCVDWAVKRHINVLCMDSEKILPEKFPVFLKKRGGVRAIGCVHFVNKYLTEDIFKKHPEYFALVNGKRTLRVHGRSQPCTNALGISDFYAGIINSFFDKHPEIEVLPLTPSDGNAYCQCAACTAKDSGEIWQPGRPIVTARWLDFVNTVANKVQKKHPGKKLYTLAYHQTMLPPSRGKLKPVGNVIVEVVHSRDKRIMCFLHEYGKCPANQYFIDIAKKWGVITKSGIWIYDYFPHSTFMGIPYLCPAKAFSDLKLLRSINVTGFEGQSSPSQLGFYLIDLYALSGAMWNPDANRTRMMKPFWRAMYGNAAEDIIELCDYLEKKMLSEKQHSCEGIAVYFTWQTYKKALAILNKALVKPLDDGHKNRLLCLKDHLVYGSLVTDAFELFNKFRQTGKSQYLAEALKSIDGIDTYKKMNPRRNFFRKRYGVSIGKNTARIRNFRNVLHNLSQNASIPLEIPNKPGIRIGVYFNAYGSKKLTGFLVSKNNINAFFLPNLNRDCLSKCDIVIIPKTKNVEVFNKSISTIRKWVYKGGKAIFMHDAVGFRKHKVPFPGIGKGNAKVNSNVLSICDVPEKIISMKSGNFRHSYFDHIAIAKSRYGKILVYDEENKPVLIVGKLKKGKVVLAGILLGYLPESDSSKISDEINEAEQKILMDCIQWLDNPERKK